MLASRDARMLNAASAAAFRDRRGGGVLMGRRNAELEAVAGAGRERALYDWVFGVGGLSSVTVFSSCLFGTPLCPLVSDTRLERPRAIRF